VSTPGPPPTEIRAPPPAAVTRKFTPALLTVVESSVLSSSTRPSGNPAAFRSVTFLVTNVFVCAHCS
jgi:hypothetical protein